MLIQDLERVGLHAETIRRLEKRGVITCRRDVNGWRRFPEQTVVQLRELYAKDSEPDQQEISQLKREG